MVVVSSMRKEVSAYSELLHAKGFVANHDGNVSVRVRGASRFLITPTSLSKRLCSPDVLVECDLDGRPKSQGRPPSEVALHVGAYRRPDVGAVVHAHPPHASAFALARREIGQISMPEVVVSLGDAVPLVRLLLPKDPAASSLVASALESSDVLLLAGNGVLAVGDDLELAYLRLELVEHYARILAIAMGGVGEPVALTPDERAQLHEQRRNAGLARPSAKLAAGGLRRVEEPSVREMVSEELRRALRSEK